VRHFFPRHTRTREITIARAGFSLVEVMVVLTVMAILVALAVPRYGRAIEQSRADIAAANLRAVWSAERLYWLENHAYSADLAALQAAGLLDPQVVLATAGYVYQVPASDSNTFTAIATRTGSARWSGAYQIDETGLVSGTIQAAGQTAIVPGFQ
jgi:prepilin-type N-terminal cleavage/methylation domain-containing protein